MDDATALDVGWWTELDDQILGYLSDGPKSTTQLAQRLGVSPAGTTSLLLMLAAQGRIRVKTVELGTITGA